MQDSTVHKRVRRPGTRFFLLTLCAATLVVVGAFWQLDGATSQAASPREAPASSSLLMPLVANGALPVDPDARTKTPRPFITPAATETATPPASATPSPTSTATATTRPTNTPTLSPTPQTTATPTPTSPPLNTSHAGRFTTYEGSKTCNECHLEQAQDMHSALHYQWSGPAPDATNVETGGKLGAINDFCGYPDINWLGILTNLDGQPTDGGCATCHTGMGARPTSEQTQEQLENIDCLTCHSETYRRKVVSEGGAFKLAPAPERMAVPLEEAITDITTPTKAACLSCHLSSGGGPNNKRGDLETALADPPVTLDVHMASQANGGAGLLCQDCHITQDHRIAGRGSDMRATDLDVPVNCTNCHDPTPHDDENLDKHTTRVDCTVCHVPAFARTTSTDMFRDFRSVEVFESRRLYEPTIERGSNVIPEVAWFNGTSQFYNFGDPITYADSGRVSMSEPNGDINDREAKLYPFKLHEALQAHDPVSNRILPMKMGILFQDGNVDLAIRKGVEDVGWDLPQGYDFVPTERWLSINHTVAPEEQALQCEACHGDSAARLDWATLGYTPKETRDGEPLCESCHGTKKVEKNYFFTVHNKHVSDKKIACAECHDFSR